MCYNMDMFPNLLGFENSSYILMLLLGVAAAIIVVAIYLKRIKYNLLDLIVCALSAVFFGIIFAILFQNLYDAIEHAYYNQPQSWTWAMTFFGGLAGGAAAFLLTYRFYYLKHNDSILNELLIIAPCGISLAHAFGRLGCFLAGCCYGQPTDSWIGIKFVTTGTKVVPTQLFEMIFLFALAIVTGIFAFKNTTIYTMPIYLISYGIWRFTIEFFRGDHRGGLPGLSPSQYWSIILILGGLVLIYLYKKKILFGKVDNK